MANIAAILRDYDARRAKPKATPRAKPAADSYDETEWFLARMRHLDETEVTVAPSREPKSIHSPAQASRIKFVAPVKKGHGRTKRWAVN